MLPTDIVTILYTTNLSCGKCAIGAELVEYERIQNPHIACGRHLLHSSKVDPFFFCCCRCGEGCSVAEFDHEVRSGSTLKYSGIQG